MSEREPTDFLSRDRFLRAAGWRKGPPPWGFVCNLLVDLEEAAEYVCPACGYAGGLDWCPYFLLRDGRYTCLLVCPCCNHAEEF